MPFKTVIRAKLDANDSTAMVEPGTIFEDGATGKTYKYVLAEDKALANGDVVEFSDTSGYEVTSDRSGGASIGRAVAGAAIHTLSDGYYGWIQTRGRHIALKVAANVAVAAGAVLIPDPTNDGCVTTAAAGSTVVNTEGQRFGFALGADTATTSVAGVVIADLRC